MKAPWRIAAGLIVMAVVVFAENLFGRELNALFLRYPGIDKVLHAVEYSFVFIFAHWLLGGLTNNVRVRIVTAVAAGLLLSVADEGLQLFVPERSVELFDLAANFSGLTLGALVALKPSRRLTLSLGTLAVATLGYVVYDTHQKLFELSLALRYEHNHEFGRAREHYLRAVAAGLSGAEVYNGLAWVSIESGDGDPRDALKYAQKAFDLQPGNPDVLDTYGWALHHAGRHDDALPHLREAYRLRPEMYCIHYHLGAVYDSLGQPHLAREHYRRQIELTGTREAGMAARALSRLDDVPR